MPVRGLPPMLFCLLSMWTTLTPASSHPQHSPCQLRQRIALCNNGDHVSVPAGLPGNIEEIQLNSNHIQTLHDDSLIHYQSISTLSLACNGLERLESNTFQHTKMLKSLNLANNDLHISYYESSFALKKLSGLQSLDLSENKLDEEMVAALLQNLTSLEYLNLSGNILQRLDETHLADLHQLKELDLQRNILFEIAGAFNANSKLQRLNLAFNSLPCLMDFHMTQLVVLNASHNIINWFSSQPDLNDTFQIETLDLSDNSLLFFPFLPSRSLLRNLYLAHNRLSFYERLAENETSANSSATVEFYNLKKHNRNITTKLWGMDLHGDVSRLEILDLRGNQVQYFPEGFVQKMPALSRLRMCSNCMETLDLNAENFSTSLYELDISNNRLNQIIADGDTLASLGNLTYLNISLNDLQWVPPGLFSSLQSLRSVDLSYNNIGVCLPGEAETTAENLTTCADWRGIVPLRQLYLRGCNLERIPPSAFSGLTLTHLELSDNPQLVLQGSLSSLSRTLQHLGLGKTHVKDLDFSVFQSLRSLNISGNSLAHFPLSLFYLDLTLLDLRHNNLSTIPVGHAISLAPKLQTVFLTGNPFDCCQTEWFRTFEATKTINVVSRSGIECKDLFQIHRIEHSQSFLCYVEERESIFWYILLFVPIVSLVGVSAFVLLTLKPNMIQKSIKKNFMKPTSY